MDGMKKGFLWVLVLMGMGLSAQEAQKLTIDQAVNLAIEHNLNLSNTKRDINAKQRKADTAWNVFIPTVDVSGTMARMNEASTVSGLAPYKLP